MPKVTAATLEGEGVELRVDRFADSCPICHTSLHPKVIGAIVDSAKPPAWAQIAFQCTCHTCLHLFVSSYQPVREAKALQVNFVFVSSAPLEPQPAQFSEEIRGLSPTFVEISNQALAAEAAGLHQLTGIGLRKALEFLVKDFAAARHPSEREAILSTTLAACIKKYLDDARLKECAKRAAWLGNDEAHYLRRWEASDVDDLKLLIRLSVNWMENVLLTERFMEELPDPAGKSSGV